MQFVVEMPLVFVLLYIFLFYLFVSPFILMFMYFINFVMELIWF